MNDLKEAVTAFVKDTKEINWEKDSNAVMGNKISYNQALKDVLLFIKSFENGDIEQEFITNLMKQQENK